MLIKQALRRTKHFDFLSQRSPAQNICNVIIIIIIIIIIITYYNILFHFCRTLITSLLILQRI